MGADSSKDILPVFSGNLVRIRKFPSRFVPERDVDIWLPDGYDEASDSRFPVLYMQDGDKVFRPEDQGGGNWGVPETISRLSKEKGVSPPIVVAVWATENRAGEYMPVKPLSLRKADLFYRAQRGRYYIPRSDEYLRFMVDELKPYIDSRCRTLSDQQNTFLMGCSRAGLLCVYAVVEFPEVFHGAACLSTHWPHGNGIVIDWLESHLPKAGKHRFYFDYGDQGLDAEYEPHQKRMDRLLIQKGYRHEEDWTTRYFPGHGHSEVYWRSRLHFPLGFFFGLSRSAG